MTIYSNGAPVRLPVADGMPPLTAPLIQALPITADGGRTYVTRTAQGETARLAHVTPRGHWYCEQDAACRGCGTELIGPAAGIARTDAVLDGQRCTYPASQQDVASALLGRQAVAA